MEEIGRRKMIVKLQDPCAAEKLFEGWNETVIWSCLDRVMGCMYADSKEHPVTAAACLGDFCFLAGEPSEELLQECAGQSEREMLILVGREERWNTLIEKCFPEKIRKFTRYAFRKDPASFDEENLRAEAAKLPEEFEIRLMDETLYGRCRQEEWSKDLAGQFRDYTHFDQYAVGIVAVKGDEIVAGASAYSAYKGGIEVEIDTKEAYRRRGLATACGARLILECKKRGLYQSWDAHNLQSKRLAQKLGYQFDYEYTSYELF